MQNQNELKSTLMKSPSRVDNRLDRLCLDRLFQSIVSTARVLGFVVLFAFPLQALGLDTVAKWEFGQEEETPLESHAGVHRDQPGPRPPSFPDFEANNTAVLFDGQGSRFTFEDPGAQSRYDFGNGDEISLEAWVNVEDLRKGENVYVIGKGRTAPSHVHLDNQNWALRIREVNGEARISFLFATEKQEGTESDRHWHRWTSTSGFKVTNQWHHIAVSYQFGNPLSIRGWVDGKPSEGRWDMGGTTTEPPIVDNDAIWLGSSQGGNSGNSFRGLMDEVAIHRGLFSDSEMAARYRKEGADNDPVLVDFSMPDIQDVPAGKVLITFRDNYPNFDRWLSPDKSLPPESDRWVAESFLLPRLPLKYDAWGIRDTWTNSVLTTLAADVKLEPGKRRFVLRARGMSRLWVDGKVIATTEKCQSSQSGEEPITPIPNALRPGTRLPSYRQQEVFGEAIIDPSGNCRVVLECLVGGAKFRHEPGELVVGIFSPDESTVYLLEPSTDSKRTALSDAEIEPRLNAIEDELFAKDEAKRRELAMSQDEFWAKRHELASKEYRSGHRSDRKIDQYLIEKFNATQKISGGDSTNPDSETSVQALAILEKSCFRCHTEKANGGLRLDTREEALKGGDSELAGLVPGDADASEIVLRISSDDESSRMPPNGDPLTADEVKLIRDWIAQGAIWTDNISDESSSRKHEARSIDDFAFIRRVSLDTIGTLPSDAEVQAFVKETSPTKRADLIELRLADNRHADHWVSYWQDVLAENPALINMSLNSTGPFRWFLWESLRDHKPIDRWVTELIMMRGSKSDGGSAGFGVAGDNDAPMAAKGQILAGAFLGLEMQCARCHDSPYHSTKQKDLYSLAAMLERKSVGVPKSSMVPAAFFEEKARESLIKVTLKPDELIEPKWTIESVLSSDLKLDSDSLLHDEADTRERLAALITGPQNKRFPQVIVNRIWRRLMGAGIVEPPHDWESQEPSHPDLLSWLAAELVVHRYDTRHIERLILNSDAYQRSPVGYNLAASPSERFFLSPDRRRMTAEQVVDSSFAAVGAKIPFENLTFDPDGRRASSNRINLGRLDRAWKMVSLNNERDRPSLSLPRAQMLDDVMSAFGWNGARQMPKTDREISPTVLQPGVLANSNLLLWLTTVSDVNDLGRFAREAESPSALVETLSLKILGRYPSESERKLFEAQLAVGFDQRYPSTSSSTEAEVLESLPQVTWSNHLVPEANTIQIEHARRVAKGPIPDSQLQPEWRKAYEDVVWSMLNNPEFVWLP